MTLINAFPHLKKKLQKNNSQDITSVKASIEKLQSDFTEFSKSSSEDKAVNDVFEDVYQEFNERQKRKCNLIIFGVAEQTSNNKDDRIKADKSNQTNFPQASSIILNDFYVDDLLTGSNDIQQLADICKQVSSILESGGFTLRKWIANNKDVLAHINTQADSLGILTLGEHECSKTLGIQCSQTNDRKTGLMTLSEIETAHVNLIKIAQYESFKDELSSLAKGPLSELKIGMLVLIKNDNQPPNKWLLGRIQQLFPGKDGISRVASITTSKGIIKRSTRHLYPLPVEPDVQL
ncbi:hypothetical protein NQ314_000251 [Rhamnusium bicolor]|uniref:DUF5641 domain-containing protein n=1 Tax=Rhamnusium bicolor TaxID=1586634 RepID=A0AAV8ZXQ6_9CUCU|nr:hypothetical protein NQ314_000251 [Rhamnusium bicolor]